MTTLPGEGASLWLEGLPETKYPKLSRKGRADVAVLGGGIAGLTTALLLRREGLDVALLDAGRVGRGVSAFSTAKVTSQHSLTYAQLARKHGPDAARAYGAANEAGLAKVAELVDELAIDCDFRRKPALAYTESEDEAGDVREEAEAAAEAGLPATFTTETDLPWDVAGAVRFEDQAEFHPLKYLAALAAAFTSEGGRIFERTRAVGIAESDDGAVVTTESGRELGAEHVVVATHFPFTDRGGFFARMHPERSYVLAVRVRGEIPRSMSISTEGHSLRAQPAPGGGEYLLVGGESHKVGQADEAERYQALEHYARERFDVESIDFRWSTQDNVPVDQVPFIGRMPPFGERVSVATGFRKWGYANGTAAALMLTDRILLRENPWAETFDPARLGPPSSVFSLIKENANVGLRFFLDRLRRGSQDDVPPGSGAIVRDGLVQKAVYRDDDGQLHAVSARCTHLGCIVQFNDAERTWDCPCHGSRFATDGRVLEGPATAPLDPR